MRNTCIIFFAVYCFFIAGCSKTDDIELIKKNEQLNFISSNSEGMIALGKKLDNPYTLKNMQKAYHNLIGNGELKSSDFLKGLEASHLYVRFLPKNYQEMELLWKIADLELFDYPLDYELLSEGYGYHDPSVPVDQPTWQYCVVHTDFVFPSIAYEILDECFIPNEDHLMMKSTNGAEFLLKLEREAFRITGNLKPENELKSTMGIAASCRPKGRIRVDNTLLGPEGVSKVKIRVRSWLKVDAVYTQASGNYIMNESFSSSDVHYDLIFENETGFRIWDNFAFLNPAVYYMLQRPKEGYSIDIGTDKTAWLWCTINNGVYQYREELCPQFAINPPPSELRLWSLRDETPGWNGSAPMGTQLSLTDSKFLDFLLAISSGPLSLPSAVTLVMPDVFIAPDYKDTYLTYHTLFHELAHTSHYTQAGDVYWLQYINGIVGNWAASNSMYGDGTGSLDGYIGVGEMWGNYFGYVCMNQIYYGASLGGTYYWFSPGILKKLVQTYQFTPQQIFNCLSENTNNHEKLKNSLIINYGKENDVKKAFSDYGY